jgi:hypothetical protein
VVEEGVRGPLWSPRKGRPYPTYIHLQPPTASACTGIPRARARWVAQTAHNAPGESPGRVPGRALCGSACTWEEAPPRWVATLTGADKSTMNLGDSLECAPGLMPYGA